MPAVLAASDAAKEKVYVTLLGAYEQALDKQKLPRNDVAVATAMYVSGAYAAYHGSQISDEAFTAVISQFRDVLASAPSFTSATLAQKQDLYEGFAIVGTLMLGSMSGQSKDGVRAAAKSYLETLFHTNVEAIQIDDHGVRIGGSARPESPQAGEPKPVGRAPGGGPPADPAPTGKEYPSSKIAAVLWGFEMHYEAFPAGGMVNREEDYILLSDGTCTSYVPSTLAGFDPAEIRTKHPKEKCAWKRSGSAFEVKTGNQFGVIPHQTVLRGAKRGERISGTYTRQRTGTSGTASTWHGTTLVFGADGRFTYKTAGAFSSNTNLNRPDGEVVVSSADDDKGSVGNVSGQSGGVGFKSSSGRGDADVVGSYALDGYSIELKYDSGRVERAMFAISTDDKHDWVRFRGEMLPKK